MNAKELVQFIAREMVDYPDAVSVSAIDSHQITILELKVAKQDLGKIIGKKGRNVKALRIILSSVSAKMKRRMVLEIIE